MMGYAMGGLDVSDLVLFIGATFAASFVAGFAGFAFGIVAAAVWLHFLSPGQSAALIVAFGLIVQGMAVWKLRRAVKLGRLAPFLIGGAIGVPIGAELCGPPRRLSALRSGSSLSCSACTACGGRSSVRPAVPAWWPTAASVFSMA
jgi:hypothetical protein